MSLLTQTTLTLATMLPPPLCSQVDAVTVCDTPDAYVFSLPDSEVRIDKLEFKTQAIALAHQEGQGHLLEEGRIAVWLVVPEINPNAAALRLVTQLDSGDLVIPVALTLPFEPGPIGYIPSTKKQSYPHTYGYQVGKVLTKLIPGIIPGSLPGLSHPRRTSALWWEWDAPSFEEENIIKSLLNTVETQGMIDTATTNDLYEWTGTRQLIFQFPLNEEGLSFETEHHTRKNSG